MNIGEKIKKVRELRDYSQEYMAIQLKMTQGGYSNLEQNGDPTYSKLKKIASIFDLTLTDLITDLTHNNFSYIIAFKLNQ